MDSQQYTYACSDDCASGVSDKDFLLGAGQDFPKLSIQVAEDSEWRLNTPHPKKAKTASLSSRKHTTKTTTYGTRRFVSGGNLQRLH